MWNSKLLKSILIPTLGVSAIGTIAAVSTSCSPVIIVTGVSLNKESLVLGIGDSDTLIATVLPENATDKSVTWSSNDSSIATVDNNGNVTAVSEGQTTITVTTNDGGLTDTCQLTVNQGIIHVIGVWMDKQSLALGIGESDALTATVLPENATDKSVTWSSSNSSVATVDDNGKVTAVSEGSAKITAKTNDGWYEDHCNVTIVEPSALYMCITANANSTLELINVGGNNPNLQYSTDGVNWTTYSEPINITQGHNMYLKGDNPTGWSKSATVYSTLSITGVVSISGNVMALLDNGAKPGEEGDITTSIPCDYCFSRLFDGSTGVASVSQDFLPAITLVNGCYFSMFEGCTSLTTVPNLQATQLADYCYSYMFRGCTSLTTAPNLPATTLYKNCYYSMFYGCSSLTVTPELPATTLATSCYGFMFNGCSSLTTAPELPATTLADYCYFQMFYKCTSLTTAPDLPATTLAVGCYSYMFYECTSLTTAPDLPATILATFCYQLMFYGCSSLIVAPVLPAATLVTSCYSYMFESCTSLNSIKIVYTGNYDSGYFYKWVNGVASSGTFYYNGSQTAQDFQLPSGWTKSPF